MKKSFLITIVFLSVSLLFSLIISFSYALWSNTHAQEKDNIVETGCFSIEFSDSGDSIEFNNAFPVTDEKGLLSSKYSFTITNTCSTYVSYQVNQEILSGTTIDPKFVKSAVDQESPVNLTQAATKTISNALSSYKVASFILMPNETQTHDVRLWIDEVATTTDVANKSLKTKIVVVSNAINFYKDESGAASPELYRGLVPITYNSLGTPVVASLTSEWYNYDKHEWANAVLVDDVKYRNAEAGTVIPEDNILQYYVWIPRYRYLLWNAENGSSDPQMINIKFEDKGTAKSTGSTNGTWLTHPAFTFGDTELNGIWVGKFENSTSDPSCQGANETEATCNKSTLPVTIKPNQLSWVYVNISNAFYAIRNTELVNATKYGLSPNQIDTHMMKNMEWGAVAYLSSSIYGRYINSSTCIESGCEVWINNVRNNSSNYVTTTGCSGTTVSAAMVTLSKCPVGYDWKNNGVNASTTANIYGIYDMSGGSNEYVMGNMVDSSNGFFCSSSGLVTFLETKYFTSYLNGTSNTNHSRGLLGDATKESLKNYGSYTGGWYGDYSSFVFSSWPWFMRGGGMFNGLYSGMFVFYNSNGGPDTSCSSRSVLTAE